MALTAAVAFSSCCCRLICGTADSRGRAVGDWQARPQRGGGRGGCEDRPGPAKSVKPGSDEHQGQHPPPKHVGAHLPGLLGNALLLQLRREPCRGRANPRLLRLNLLGLAADGLGCLNVLG
jgi:hypothetical protein